MSALNDRLFQAFARRFPTERIGDNGWGAAWRIGFYAMAPSEPFVMRTPHYSLWAHPKKGTLTRAVIRRGVWERALTERFVQHLRPGMFVIDAGANFGHFGLAAAQVVGPTGRVLAFEPHGPTFAMLERNIALNGFDHMSPVRAALSDVDGQTILIADSANPGGHSLDAANVGTVAGESAVPVHSLDRYLADHAEGRRLDLLKIDVQGFEAHLLSGAAQTLARDKPVVFCEVSPDMVRRAGRTTEGMLAPFKAGGYQLTAVWDSRGETRVLSFEEAEAMFAASDSHVDLILTPPV